MHIEALYDINLAQQMSFKMFYSSRTQTVKIIYSKKLSKFSTMKDGIVGIVYCYNILTNFILSIVSDDTTPR